ncbi:MAG: hypothetical protein K2H47_12645, partial [Muribaculaceae bacterium]|nr:hypothetical protein [Muribaculaceae bacterium]
MKILPSIFLILLSSGCTAAQSDPAALIPFEIKGDTLPPIRHITDMKISGDTLFFVYERENGFGQRFLRRAIIDSKAHTLTLSQDIGSEISYMPYPFIGTEGNVKIVSQDNGKIYNITSDANLQSTGSHIFSSATPSPVPLSNYINDIYTVAPDKYIFLSRQPKGGPQYITTSDTNSRIDTIHQTSISSDLTAWMPNLGKLTYSDSNHLLAFAYLFHPVIEFLTTDGAITATTEIGPHTFNPSTLDEADFESLNPFHTIDITPTRNYLYVLHWGYLHSKAEFIDPTIFQLDWNGKIINRYFNIPRPLYNIAAYDDTYLIGWTGTHFIQIPVNY